MPESYAEQFDYRAVVEARGTLYAAAAVLRDAAYGAESPNRAARLALASSACDHGEEALFQVLNYLSSFADDWEAGRLIHAREWPGPDADAVEPV
jgi:hypothetical protein